MITVLRLGHRVGRDARISTHCGLVARAFGAGEIIFSGEEDEKLMNSVREVTKEWGGPFSVKYEKNWKSVIQNFKGIKVHLTMYGIPIEKRIDEIRKKRNVLVIIGGSKVPGEVYALADYNIAITNQPHSEVAALAIFLHEYFQGRELRKRFKNPKIRVIPQEKGKKVIS
ncbi:MAG TPA: tRNA (cytidine(56)-2'-O)-methyltransferase [Candidatus Aenigmarchaeota archaeon]|nr:tRNA (cytidine(56)-2'-O)-methyltransferase [Candidatus Aenigmarchaeota archaeon]